LKFKSSKDYRRKDAMKAARLGSVLVHQFCNVKKPHFRQFEQALVDANNWAKSQANLKECYIAENEISFWAAIVQKFKAPNGYTGKEDQIELDRKFLPQEITDQLKVLDEVDHDKFVEGIDTESVAYQYINRLNQFRIEQSVSTPFRLTDSFIGTNQHANRSIEQRTIQRTGIQLPVAET
jgi:hypothetical protein